MNVTILNQILNERCLSDKVFANLLSIDIEQLIRKKEGKEKFAIHEILKVKAILNLNNTVFESIFFEP